MRLCWSDSFGGPLRNMSVEEAKVFYAMGFRVVGINSGDADATDADIDRARKILDDTGLMPGPYGGGRATFHPDPSVCSQYKKELARVLKIAGKLGCPTVRVSGGTMHPTNPWLHHPENHTQKALDLFVENTRELVPVAEDSRCTITPETTQWTIINSVERMKEFVDRLDSPYVKIILDPVNHMTYDRVYDSGSFIQCAIATLGDRIGDIHVKDVMVQDKQLVSHIDEAKMGTGVLDHEALIEASSQLAPWKTFSLEHISDRGFIKEAHDYIQGVADRIGHTWSDPACTRERYEKGMYK